VSADVAAAMKFPEELIMIIKHREYSPKQIFSVDETGLSILEEDAFLNIYF
jgi:hypothetical protein